MFWLHTSYHDSHMGYRAWSRKPFQATLAVLTILAGAFLCVAGTYVTVNSIVQAYASGSILPAFTCGT